MKTRNDWLVEGSAATESANAVIGAAKAAGRSMTDEEEKQVQAHLAKHKECMAEVAKLDRQAELEAAAAGAAQTYAVPGSPAPAADISGTNRPRVSVDEPNLIKDKKFGFKDFNDFGMAVYAAAMNARNGVAVSDPRLAFMAEYGSRDGVRAAYGQNTFTGSEGGFLIPPEFANAMFSRMTESRLPIIAQCNKYAVNGDTLTISALKDHDKSDSAYRYGGLVVYWVGEGKQITRSKLNFREVTYTVHDMAVMAFVTEKMLRQVSNYPTTLMDKIEFAIRDTLEEALCWGNGVGKPQGVFNSPAVVSVDRESGQGSTVVTKNISKMYSRLWEPSLDGANWFRNRTVDPELDSLNVSVGTGGQLVYIPAGGISGRPFDTMKGLPSFPTDHMEALGTAGDIGLADFRQCDLVTRANQKLDLAMSVHLRFDYAEVAYRAMFGVGGGTPWDQAVTPRKGGASATESPFVILAAPA